MHLRGKDFQYTIVYPDGRARGLLSVPKYDFNWQLMYQLQSPIALPKGTRIECVAHFDNSPNNKYNPDPTKEVKWGEQTWEEMMIGFFTTRFRMRPGDDSTAAGNSGGPMRVAVPGLFLLASWRERPRARRQWKVDLQCRDGRRKRVAYVRLQAGRGETDRDI